MSKSLRLLQYILIFFLCFHIENNYANTIPQTNDDPILLSYKLKKSDKLCEKKPFYLNGIDIVLSQSGELSVSLIQLSKSPEGFVTHLSVQFLDKKGRVLTEYNTPTLTLKNRNESEIRTKNYFFNENFKYQFSAEEFKIFIDNVKDIKVNYNGCNDPNLKTERELLSRNLPKEIIEEFIHKTPLVVE